MVALRERYKEAKDRVEELETVNGALRDAASNNLARVEELGKDNESLLGKIVFLREGAEKREARVKELEEKAEFWELKAIGKGLSPRITPEMIDVAVEFANGEKGSGAWISLNKLNIFRCEGCGGAGVVNVMEPGAFLKHNEDCPDCTGHSWVIKEPK